MWTQIRVQGQSDPDLHCFKEFSNVSADNKNIRLFVICALRVNTCEVSVYGQDFHEMHARLHGSKAY